MNAQSIEALASQNIEEIRRVQPHGPYTLGGAYFGGIVTFEIAQQLVAEGEVIAGPIMAIDSFMENKDFLEKNDLERLLDDHLYSENWFRSVVRRMIAPGIQADLVSRYVTWAELSRGN